MLILVAALLGGLALVPSLVEGLATGVLAQGTASVDWWVVAGGGGASSADEVVVNSTLGQPIIGSSGEKPVALGAGYWYGAEGPPTAVTLAAFTATPVDGNILVEWETAMEIDTVGFNLYRSESPGGPYAKLNNTLIPSQSPGSVFGASYAWLDEDVQGGLTYYYKLEELEVGGGRNWYGPVSTGDDNPNSVILSRATAEGTGYAALAWWLAGAAVAVGAGLVAIWRIRKRSAGSG
jgi:hypothetical protein